MERLMAAIWGGIFAHARALIALQFRNFVTEKWIENVD